MKQEQFLKFQKLIRRVYEKSSFYHEKLDEAGIRPEDIRNIEDIKKI